MSEYVVYQDLNGNRKVVFHAQDGKASDNWHYVNGKFIGVIEDYNKSLRTMHFSEFGNDRLLEALTQQSAVLVENLQDTIRYGNSVNDQFGLWDLVKEFYEYRYTGT